MIAAYENQEKAESLLDGLSNGDSITFTFCDPDLKAHVIAEPCGYFLMIHISSDGLEWSRNHFCDTAWEVSCNLNDASLGVCE